MTIAIGFKRPAQPASNVRRAGSRAILAAASTLLLAGCGSDVNDSASGGSTPENGITADTEAATDEEIAVELSPSECLVGTWLSDNDLSLAQMASFGDGVIENVTGDVYVTYESDGSMKLDYQDWLITGSAEGVSMTIHRHGTDEGEYSATDSELTFRDTSVGSITTVSGAGMDMTVDPEPTAYTDAPYTCGPDDITLTTPDGDVRMTRQ